jgi:glycosyltransferase involved in cell wall biosynthesis
MFSIIIPTHESERALVATLAALVPGAAAGLINEVIVADGGSGDDTAEVAELAGCRVLVASAPLAARLRAAAAAARAPWLLFLRPGLVPDPTWTSETARFVEAAEGAGRADAQAAAFRPGPGASALRPALIEALGLLAVALGRRARPDQGLLISREFYRNLGGHRDGAADCEADLLRRIGGRRLGMLRCGIVDTTR